jgi:carboxyl-terminal processing protease
MVDDEVGYIRIDNFNRNTHTEFAASLSMLKDQGMTKLILDLQGNPGGILTEAVEIVDELMERKRLVTYTEGQASPRFDYKTQRFGLFEEGELVILIDQGSASASEILAGAVQDWDRGLIIGRRSFGKGLVQRQIELSDGSALRLTIARYYTPSGRSIQKPYENGYFEYDSEVYDRYENGEIYYLDSFHLEDSTEYLTMGGRVVYGGGGIMPDVFVPRDTVWKNDEFLMFASHARSFTDKWYARHSLDFEQFEDEAEFVTTWQIPDNFYQRFIEYVITKEDTEYRPSMHEREVLNSMMKAELAKFLWGDNAYYKVFNQTNESMQRALVILSAEKA